MDNQRKHNLLFIAGVIMTVALIGLLSYMLTGMLIYCYVKC